MCSGGDMKKNCWEFKKCGRGPDGEKVHELGECPASQETRLDGKNSGKNGGRCCWVVEGTLCASKIQSSFVHKLKHCKKCPFYISVHEEEGSEAEDLMVLFDCIMDLNGDIR